MGLAPENTLASIAKALELKVDWIEIDVQLVGSRLVVIHDFTLDRTTNGSGVVVEQNLEYLRSLDAGSGERIPFLEEVFDAIAGRNVVLDIEIKTAGAAQAVVEAIKGQNALPLSNILVSSFEHRELVNARALLSELRIAPIIQGLPVGYPNYAKLLGASAIVMHKDFISEALVEETHAHALEIITYTVNSPAEAKRLSNCGVDGIVTNFPDRLEI